MSWFQEPVFTEDVFGLLVVLEPLVDQVIVDRHSLPFE